MAARHLKTSDLAAALGVHANTIRLYESLGYLPPVPRGANGYRRYGVAHLEQARLIRLALQWPYIGPKAQLVELVQSAAGGDLGHAMELAYAYLAQVRMERIHAEAAVELLERWAAGQLLDAPREPVYIRRTAQQLHLSIDTLRRWERNGLIDVPRDPRNRYRVYTSREFGRLRVIRALAQAGYSQMAILRMLLQLDAGNTADLRGVLDRPREDEEIYSVADRWLSTLLELEQRATAMIEQIGRLLELAHAPATR